jgi:phosphoribosylglycinamide formyltransferase-1
MLNIHPSLLPSFPGLHTHRQALEAGVKLHGATVHFVTAELDHGPIVAQEAVPVLPDDTEATLSALVLEVEHRLYPAAVLDAVEGRLSISNGCVRVAPKPENYLTLKESA